MAYKNYNYFDNKYERATRTFNNYTEPYKLNRPNSDVVDTLYQRKKDYAHQNLDIDNQRSLLDRGFDLLLTPNYMSAGFAKGLVDNGSENDISPWRGMVEGFKAGNPFGEGNERGEYTYSKVLEEMGWEGNNWFSKFGRGATGFALDVLLDPTTYLTGGLSAVAKGTGRVGRASDTLSDLGNIVQSRNYDNIINDLTSKGVNPDLAKRFADKKIADNPTPKLDFMDSDIATTIIKHQNTQRGVKMSDEQIAKGAEELSDKYNKLLGLRDVGEKTPITFGIRNLPFIGDKLGDKMGVLGNTIKLSDGDAVRAFSDKTGLSTAYSKLRDSIYGSQVGRMFSPNSKLYDLAHKDPAKLMDYLRFVEKTRGMSAEKLKSEKAMRDYAKTLNLTPAESKEVIQLLQDKTIWSKVSEITKITEAREAKDIQRKLIADKEASIKALNELNNEIDMYEGLKKLNDDQVLDTSHVLDELRNKKYATLSSLNLKHFEREGLEDIRTQLQKNIDELDAQYQKITSNPDKSIVDVITKNFEDFNEQNKLRKEGVSEEGVPAWFDLVDNLSAHVYGQKGFIGYDTRYSHINKIMDMVKKGDPKHVIENYMQKNPNAFTGRSQEIHKEIGKLMGYGENMKYKSIDDLYFNRVKEYEDVLKSGRELTEYEAREIAELQQIGMQYRLLKNKFYDMSPDEFRQYLKQHANNELFKDLDRVLREQPQRNFSDNDSAVHQASKQFGDERNPLHVDKSRKEIESDFEKGLSGYKREMEVFENGEVKKVNANHAIGHEKEEVMMRIVTDLMVHRVGADTSLYSRNMKPSDWKFTNKVLNEVDDLLNNFFRRSYSDMTEPQKNLMMKMAYERVSGKADKVEKAVIQEANKIYTKRSKEDAIRAVEKEVTLNHEVSFHDGKRPRAGKVTKIERSDDGRVTYDVTVRGETHKVRSSDVKSVRKDKQSMTPEQLVKSSPIAKNVLEEKESLLRELREVQEEMKHVNVNTDTIKATENAYDMQIKKYEENMKALEEKSKMYEEELHKLNPDNAQALMDDIEEINRIMDNRDAFEAYLKREFGDTDWYKAQEKKVSDSVRIALDDMPYNDKVKGIVKTLRHEFDEIARKEVGIRKLSQEQVDKFLGAYIPHVLTADGQKYFKDLRVTKEHGSAVTHDLGYGVKFNPFSKSRTEWIKLPDGQWVKNDDIVKVNEAMRPFLRGKNAFSENIADIYLTRALKNSELMYDNEYMKTMMYEFGDELKVGTPVKDGYKAVMNYGELKEFIRKEANMRLSQREAMGMKTVAGDFDQMNVDIIKQLGLPEGILDDLATPMIELSEGQITKVQQYAPTMIRQVNDAIVQKANQTRKLQQAKDESRLLQMYDKFLHFIKLNQTTVMPAFHLRNKYSNMFLNWLGVGRDAVNMRYQIDAMKVAYNRGDVSSLKQMKPININNPHPSLVEAGVNSGQLHWNELYELAKAHDVIDEGFFAKDLGAGAMTTGKLPGVPAKFDPTDTANFIAYQKGAEVGTVVENSDRLIHFMSMLKQGKSVRESAESSKKFLFDYSDLTAFEQSVMKRIFPYYTWLRKNGRLQLSQMAEQPGKYRDTAKALNMVEGQVNSEDRVNKSLMSDFAQDWVQTPFKSGEEPVLWNPNLPFMDLTRMPNPFNPSGSGKDLFAQTAPQVKLPIEFAMNKNVFFDSEIAREGENVPLEYGKHALNQLAMSNAVGGGATKEGLDLGLHLGNIFTGQKFLSYDYETFKNMKIAEIAEQSKEK